MNPRRQELETIMRMMARALEEEMNDVTTGPPIGYCLLLFDFDAGGFCAHASNANREDLAKLLREHAGRLEAHTESTKGES